MSTIATEYKIAVLKRIIRENMVCIGMHPELVEACNRLAEECRQIIATIDVDPVASGADAKS